MEKIVAAACKHDVCLVPFGGKLCAQYQLLCYLIRCKTDLAIVLPYKVYSVYKIYARYLYTLLCFLIRHTRYLAFCFLIRYT